MKSLRFFAIAAFALTSCAKEISPNINFGVPAVDTTYETVVEATTPKRVLIEEFTGVTCTNCPAGHRAIKQMIADNNGLVSAIGYQPFNIAQANPSAETRNDNRTQKATDLGNSFGGILFLPCATFNRTPEDGEFLRARPYWAAMLSNRLKETAPMNITLTNMYDSSNRELKVKVHIAYTAEVATKHRLTLALTENKVVDAQEEIVTGTSELVTHKEYEHEHVFRDFLTTTTGEGVLDAIAAKKAGRVYDRYFTVKLNSKWNADNCVLIGFVHNEDGAQKNILQVAEKSVK